MILNSQQQQAVQTAARRVLVLAGPGAGKTRVITERVRHLVRDCGVSGHDVLLLTFTRRAAAEMQSRITEAVGERETRKMWIGTFHAVCLRILREYGEKLGYKPATLTVYDECDQRDLLTDIVAARGAKIKQGALGEVLQAFGTRGWSAIDEYRRLHPTECAVFDEYRMRLRENNAVDYGLILAEVQRMFTEHQDVLEHYHAKFRHVLVDEYQDTDRLQYNLHTLLEPAYLFCVGDSDQAIYSFRGATIEVLLDFATDHFDATTLELPLCYRCGREIVTAANALIGHNEKRIAKSIEAALDHESSVTAHCASADDAEPRLVVDVVKDVLGTGDCEPRDIAVLARTRRWLQPIGDALTAAGIPAACIDQDRDFYERPDAKLFHAFMTLAVNDRDNLAFLRTRHAIGVDDALYAQIRLHATQSEQSHAEAAVALMARPLFDPAKREANGTSLRSWTEMLLQTKGLRRDTIEELRRRIDAWLETGPDDVHEYLLWLQQRDMQDALIEDRNVVRVMTIHAAKGLEFHAVIVAGAIEGHLPHSRAGSTEAGLEEERRLMYVAATRAKAVLCITFPLAVQRGMVSVPAKVSRFVLEMIGGHNDKVSADSR